MNSVYSRASVATYILVLVTGSFWRISRKLNESSLIRIRKSCSKYRFLQHIQKSSKSKGIHQSFYSFTFNVIRRNSNKIYAFLDLN